jgi:hypothetical protein
VNGAVGFWLAADALPVLGAPWLDADRLRALGRRRLSRLLRTAGRTGFYEARLREAGVTTSSLLVERDPAAVLAGLAPVTKAELREAGTALFVGGRQRPGGRASTSAGPPGEPSRVYSAPRAGATLKMLVKLRARRRCGLEVGHRVALLDAVPPVDASPDGGPAGRVARISVLQPPEVVAAQLVAFAPDAVYGPPSALREAGAILQGGGARFRVPLIFTSGELLHPGARAAISRAFQGRVFDVYGSSETKEIAWECPAGGMHVNADVVRVEIVDEDGRSVPDGAEGRIGGVKANTLKEWKYQSSLELDPRTFERLRARPRAEELVVHGRQELVKRLDSYEFEHTELLRQVVDLVSSKFMPIITRHALSGRATVNSQDPVFNEPLAIPMLIDIFSERGYHAVVDKTIQQIPERIDLETGEIKFRTNAVYRIQITFEASKIRRG